MLIRISNKLLPFSISPGVRMIIPYTLWQVQIFPTKLILEKGKSCSKYDKKEIIWDIRGPFCFFSAVNDLEKGSIKVYSKNEDGNFFYIISAKEKNIVIDIKKIPNSSLSYLIDENRKVINKGENISLPINNSDFNLLSYETTERLCFGVHKKQQWERVVQRKDLKEILPIWLRIGQYIPCIDEKKSTILKKCEEAIAKKDVKNCLKYLMQTFQTSLSSIVPSIMVPSLVDDQFHGIFTDDNIEEYHPFILLKKGSKLIRSLFFQEHGNKLIFFPLKNISSFFPCGRFINIKTDSGIICNMMFSKRKIHTVTIKTFEPKEIELCFPSYVKSFRLRKNRRQKGKIYKENSFILNMEDSFFILDRFQK